MVLNLKKLNWYLCNPNCNAKPANSKFSSSLQCNLLFNKRNLFHNAKLPCQKSLTGPVKLNLSHSFSDESSSNPKVRQNCSNALSTCQKPSGWQISLLEVGSSRVWTCSMPHQPELEISLWEQLQRWPDPKHCSMAINILLPSNLTDFKVLLMLFLHHFVPLLEIQGCFFLNSL